MRPTPLLPALVVALALAACGGTGGGGGTWPARPEPGALDGRTFVSTEVRGRDLVPGSEIRLEFRDGSLGGSAGCNSFGGEYRVEDRRLLVGPMHITEMACEQPLMDQESWVTALLASGPAMTLDEDRLVLTGDNVEITLLDRTAAEPDRPLEGTRWVVESIVTGDAVSSVPADVTAALRFVDGRLELEAGCNRGGGAIEVADGIIAFGPIALTRMACEPPAMEVEAAVLRVLTGRVGYEIGGDMLQLGGGNGPGLVLRATPEGR